MKDQKPILKLLNMTILIWLGAIMGISLIVLVLLIGFMPEKGISKIERIINAIRKTHSS
jgi:ABC-type antimicrobial peptide transport system permease subunit